MNEARLLRCLPVVLAIASVGASSVANAQPPPPTAGARNADDVNRADAAFKHGLRLYADKRWSEAEAAFLAAFALNPTFDVASNLGAAQYQLGKHRDAAEHLAFALRQWPLIGGPARRQIAEDRLRECRAHVGALAIKVNGEHAGVLVDGRPVGIAPLDLEVFVEPGRHVVEARLEGYETARQELEATAGAAATVALVLVAKAPPKVASAAPDASKGPEGAPQGAATTGAETTPPSRSVRTEVAPLPSFERRPIWPAVMTGALAVGGLAVGTGLTVAANAKRADGDALRAVLPGSAPLCAGTPAGSTAMTCAALKDAAVSRDALSKGAVASFVLGGALALTTAGLGWWAAGSPRSEHGSALRVRVLPFASANGGGLVVVGER